MTTALVLAQKQFLDRIKDQPATPKLANINSIFYHYLGSCNWGTSYPVTIGCRDEPIPRDQFEIWAMEVNPTAELEVPTYGRRKVLWNREEVFAHINSRIKEWVDNVNKIPC